MIRYTLIALILAPLAAQAQENTFIDLTMPDFSVRAEPDKEVRGCLVPGRPEWLMNIPGRETYRATLIRLLHDSIWIAEVEAAELCTCEMRWPTWDKTLETYFIAYGHLSIDTQQTIAQELNNHVAPRRQAANSKCVEAGQ